MTAVTAARSLKGVRLTSTHTWRAMMSNLRSKNDELRYNELNGVSGSLVVIAIIAVLIAMPIPCWTILFLLNP